MENVKEEWYVNQPPILDGMTNDYWKAFMASSLKSMDNKTRKVIIEWWNPYKIIVEDKNETIKPEQDLTTTKDKEVLRNSRALDSIYNGVDTNIFKIINTYTSAKEPWETLEVAHKGKYNVHMSRLQAFTTKFENLKMREDETIYKLNVWLRDIAYNSFALGEKKI